MQPASVQAVADQLAMDCTTLTTALKPRQRRGLVDVVVAAAQTGALAALGRAFMPGYALLVAAGIALPAASCSPRRGCGARARPPNTAPCMRSALPTSWSAWGCLARRTSWR